MGFRKTRQASEALFTLHRLTELVQEWELPLTILRLDISKAFDRMHQSAILKMLTESTLHPSIIFKPHKRAHRDLYPTTALRDNH